MGPQSLDEHGVVKQTTNSLLEVALPTDAPPDIRKIGSGQQLAQARANANLSVEALAARLRLSTAQVLALDAERWEQLPDLAFVRAALRAYGKQIDVDVKPLIEHVGGFAEPAVLEPTSAVEPVVKSAGGGGFGRNPSSWLERFSRHRRSAIAVVGVLCLCLVLMLSGGLGEQASSVRVQAVPIPGASPPGVGDNTQFRPAIASVGNTVVESAQQPMQEPTPTIGTGGSIIRLAPDPVTIQNASVATTVRPSAGNGPDPAADDGRVRVAGAVTVFPVQMPDSEPVHIHFSKRAWVDISHKDGVKLLSGIQNANQSFKLDGTPPMRVQIGNPTGVAIEFRGQLVDLKSKTNDKGVASFTLN